MCLDIGQPKTKVLQFLKSRCLSSIGKAVSHSYLVDDKQLSKEMQISKVFF